MKDIPFLGWCYEEKDGKAAHDKIWGIIRAQGEHIVFWGRRGKSLTFKRAVDYDDVWKMRVSKEMKGYRQSSMDEMIKNDPEFEDRFDEAIILCQLGNFFHTS